MSTAAMNAVPAHKAGVGSGILSMSRMVGGTFGVAAIGALFQHIARADLGDALAGTGVSAAQQEHLVEGLGTAIATAGGLPPAGRRRGAQTPSSTRCRAACGCRRAWRPPAL